MDSRRVAELERQVRDLQQANDILLAAAVLFASKLRQSWPRRDAQA